MFCIKSLFTPRGCSLKIYKCAKCRKHERDRLVDRKNTLEKHETFQYADFKIYWSSCSTKDDEEKVKRTCVAINSSAKVEAGAVSCGIWRHSA